MRRVLVVDDDDAIREVAALALQAVGGYDVVTASGGAEAVRIAGAERPDAILLDVMMPDQDGPTTLAALQDDPATSGIAVIFLTAKAQADEQRSVAALPGATGVIPKPFDPMSLPDEVARLLGWPS